MTTSVPSPPWIELPRDVTANILCRLGHEEMLNTAEKVCTTWRSVCGDPSLWRVFHEKYPYGTPESQDRAGIMCRRAVDRSQGEMIEINVNYIVTNNLLRYISERSCHLKILSLEYCYNLSGKVLAAAVKNFNHLEELHLFLMHSISGLDIEKIGDSCRTLKSFTFYNNGCDLSFSRQKGTDNSDALSIAKKMPNLVRLGLYGNLLNNQGLLAILNGCPKLESLDLGGCFGVDLHCDGLGRRCSEKIKVLRHPSGDCNGQFYDPELSLPPNLCDAQELYLATLEREEMLFYRK